MPDAKSVSIEEWRSVDGRAARQDRIATEVPLALTYNRRSHVVMMGTPAGVGPIPSGAKMAARLHDAERTLVSAEWQAE